MVYLQPVTSTCRCCGQEPLASCMSARHSHSQPVINPGEHIVTEGNPLLLGRAGYPLTSGTVYSSMALPRSSVTRPCLPSTSLTAAAAPECLTLSRHSPPAWPATTIPVIGTSAIGNPQAVHLLGLTWHLRHGESQLYENGLSSADHQQEDRSKTRPTSSIHLLDTLNPENTHAGDREKWVRGRAIDRGEVDIGTQQSQAIPPGLFWRFHMTVHHPTYIKFNLSLSHNALLGVYGRRNIPPTHTQ
ncbi:teneurin-1, partial [Lates japonicus]